MASIGLSGLRGGMLLDAANLSRANYNEYAAEAPVREATRKMNLDAVKQYFADENLRNKGREAKDVAFDNILVESKTKNSLLKNRDVLSKVLPYMKRDPKALEAVLNILYGDAKVSIQNVLDTNNDGQIDSVVLVKDLGNDTYSDEFTIPVAEIERQIGSVISTPEETVKEVKDRENAAIAARSELSQLLLKAQLNESANVNKFTRDESAKDSQISRDIKISETEKQKQIANMTELDWRDRILTDRLSGLGVKIVKNEDGVEQLVKLGGEIIAPDESAKLLESLLPTVNSEAAFAVEYNKAVPNLGGNYLFDPSAVVSTKSGFDAIKRSAEEKKLRHQVSLSDLPNNMVGLTPEEAIKKYKSRVPLTSIYDYKNDQMSNYPDWDMQP